jgi:hypothetical protein
MKDLRGTHAAAVCNGILKEFGLQVVSNRQKNTANDISAWKKSKKVRECFHKLYDENENAIENIATHAFPQVDHEDKSFDNIYVYTVAVCDIVLNPDYPDIECAKKPLLKRFLKFKVLI